MLQGSIPALITPFQADGSLDIEQFTKLIERQLENKSSAIVVAGTTGESPTLTLKEFDVLTEVACHLCRDKIPVIVGTGTNSTAASIKRTKRARDLGADYALVTVPYYNKPMDAGILAHYRAIGELGLPQIVYHHPGRTGRTLSPDMLYQLSTLDSVAAIKDSSGDLNAMKELMEKGPEAALLCGEDSLLLEYLDLGAKGTIGIMPNAFPTIWSDIVSLHLTNNRRVATNLYDEHQDVMQALFLEVNPAGIKSLLALKGLCQDSLRLPLVSANKETQAKIKKALQELEEALI